MRTSKDGLEIKRELYKSYLILARVLFQQSNPNLTTPAVGDKNKRFLAGSIMFLAFAMESFINDFGERYVEEFEDLEKIEPINKFLIFPKLTKTKRSSIVKKSEVSYSSLKILFKYRNYFVHYKPAFRNTATTDEQLYENLNHAEVVRLYKHMINLMKKINAQYHMFKGGNDWIGIYSENISAGV